LTTFQVEDDMQTIVFSGLPPFSTGTEIPRLLAPL
jgi:hypothetical protein